MGKHPLPRRKCSPATSGLFGSQRGTCTGTLEDTAGGALIGEQIGGPWGAAIGAAAGFTARAVEKLLGIESPQRKAHDDIKSIYGVDIPQNSGTIKQVVQIAQSQFGGQIAAAVRSPSVRQLVMLYSEATGQRMPLSATTPYAGSLVEQGGKLYQQTSYQDGQAHAYASNIPTLGGIATGTYPTPGGPNTAGGAGATSLSLNISGIDAANFMTGQFVQPAPVTTPSARAGVRPTRNRCQPGGQPPITSRHGSVLVVPHLLPGPFPTPTAHVRHRRPHHRPYGD